MTTPTERNPFVHLVDAIRDAVHAYDATHDHIPSHGGVMDHDCVRCHVVKALGACWTAADAARAKAAHGKPTMMREIIVTNVPFHAYATARVKVPVAAGPDEIDDAIAASLMAGAYAFVEQPSVVRDDLDVTTVEGGAWQYVVKGEAGDYAVETRVDASAPWRRMQGDHGECRWATFEAAEAFVRSRATAGGPERRVVRVTP